MKDLLEIIAPFRKALIPYVVTICLAVLGTIGVLPEMTIEQVITLAVTSLGVYLIPNKKA